MPAEWEPHDAVWVGFPSRKDTWWRREDGSCPARAAYAQLAALIATKGGEAVNVCASAADLECAEDTLRKAGLRVVLRKEGRKVEGEERQRRDATSSACVSLYQIEQDDAWFRDTGPCFCVGEDG